MKFTQPNPYKDPTELLLQCLAGLSAEDINTKFAPDGAGFFLQEVIDAKRVCTTTDLLDSFSFSDPDAVIPKPEIEEWWIVFQWHPAKKQLLTGDQLRERIARK